MTKSRVIIVSHMFPNNIHNMSGVFVLEQVKRLELYDDLDITVVSPVPYSPRLLWFKKKWLEYGSICRKQEINGLKVYYPRYISLPGEKLFFLQGMFMAVSLLLFFRKIISKKEQVLVHCHTILPDGLAVALVKRFYPNMHSVCTMRGSDINIYPFRTRMTMRCTRYALKRHDQLTTVSSALKKKVLEISNVDPDIIEPVVNGVDQELFKSPEEFNTGSLFNKFNIGHDKQCKYILFVGNLNREKGIYELLGAFSTLVDRYPEARLIYVGDGPEYQPIKDKCENTRLSGKVFFTARVSHEEVSQFMQACDIFVLPSYSEGIPNVMFEAMASSLPIVISDVGGVCEIIDDGESGLIVRPQNSNDILAALSRLFDSPELGRKLGLEAYSSVTRYTWEENARNMYNLYQRTMGIQHIESSIRGVEQ